MALPWSAFRKVLRMTALMFIAAASSQGHAAEAVKVSGSGTGLATMRLLAEAYEKGHPGARIEILPSLGSSGGIKAVLQGAIDIAISSRTLKQDEIDRGAVGVEYARTPLVFVTSARTAKADLTTAELESIYTGDVQRWPEGSRLRLVMRPAAESMTGDLKRISPKMDGAVTAALAREGMIVAVTDQDNAEMLEKTPGALGASTLTQIVSERLKLRVLSYNGVKPSVETLADGSYPLSRSLILVTMQEVKPPTRDFISFIRSASARDILKRNGSVPGDGGKGR